MHKGVGYALLAAALFGASTPFSKMLVGEFAPVALAALLYLGSGIGLLAWFSLRELSSGARHAAGAGLVWSDLPWLAGAIVAGGIAGPVLLMFGLALTPASSASLLLNLESVFSALLAWFVFKENFDRRILLGMALIVLAGVLLLSLEQAPEGGLPWGALAIVAACGCWAVDNNLTRRVSAGDALQIAGIKGMVAGAVNLAIALALGMPMPDGSGALIAGTVGFCGYGLSLVLFVLALRHLGTARTAAYFSTAPLVGAAVSLLLLGETPGAAFWLAAALMAAGIWLHISETHRHHHEHGPMHHAHGHEHDEHHQHAHNFPWNEREAHAHAHQHEPLVHAHKHFPDIHHRHPHDR
jgi:drug/metabolite transporter (DMT)-like permease